MANKMSITVRTGHGKTDWFQIGKGLHAFTDDDLGSIPG